MSVDSKMFVVCDSIEKMEVGKVALKAMQELVYSARTKKAEELGVHESCLIAGTSQPLVVLSPDAGYFTHTTSLVSYDFESFRINFGIGDEHCRSLYMHLTCRCDVAKYLEEEEDAVVFSIGCWGSNTLIMQTLAEALADKWPVFYDMNDCDDVDYQLFEGNVK